MGLRVLVVDDSALFRRALSDALARIAGTQVVGTASNGKLALQRIRELKPDLLTLDIEMPEMGGLDVLDAMRADKLDAGVLVVSALTTQGGHLTVRALDKGAFDFILKPSGGSAEQNLKLLTDALAPRLTAFARRREIQAILRGDRAPIAASSTSVAMATPGASSVVAPLLRRPELLLIGVSTGGPVALGQLLPQVPGDLDLPVLIVQHMPPLFTKSLADSLNGKCAIRVCEAEDGQAIQPNVAYIAQGGKQMKLVPGGAGGGLLRITDDPPENNCKPAVDYLFRSVANGFPGKALAVILTGMGNDGTLGLRLLKRHGCRVIAQNEASCVVFGMPRAAIEAGVVDDVLPLVQIAAKVAAVARGRLG